MRRIALALLALALTACQTVNVISESPGSSGQSLRPSEAVEMKAIDAANPAKLPDVAPASDE